jgi:two-component system, OmpR family, response regulator MprA
MATILIVDDEPAVRESLAEALELEAYRVIAVEDGERALDAVARGAVDAIVLDVSMPRLDGLAVCARLRAGGSQVPILMLTARDALDDRVAGLEAGADDYLPKPFALRELVARLRAIMRRSPAADVLRVDDLVVDRGAHRVLRGGRVIALTRTEFLLLEFLLAHAGQVLSRSQIMLGVWGYDFGPENGSLSVYVGYLRRKLGEPRLVHTVRGVGYVLRREA